jgi:Na+-translocating ferredoxin:NAD+ oxidoreductase RnfG subunit
MKMKHLVIIAVIFIGTTSFGQVTPDDLPKPVARFLNNQYKKQEVVLEELKSAKQKTDRFYSIQTVDTAAPSGYLHLGTVNTCRAGGCSGPGNPAASDIKGEYFDYLIIFNNDLSVETIQIFNYQASYGHEIAARGWLKQFRGFKGETELEPGKNIDVISGATVSVHAITDDVQWKTKLLQEMLQ